MRRLSRARVALVTAIAVLMAVPAAGQAAPHKHHPHHHHTLRLPADYTAWSRVARCEEGRTVNGKLIIWWNGVGNYPDPLGISAAAWAQFGGGSALTPGPASLADQIHSIHVADRLIAYYHASIPDQYGCAAW